MMVIVSFTLCLLSILFHFTNSEQFQLEKIDDTGDEMTFASNGGIWKYRLGHFRLKPFPKENLFHLSCLRVKYASYKRVQIWERSRHSLWQYFCKNNINSWFPFVDLTYDKATNTFSTNATIELNNFKAELECKDNQHKIIRKKLTAIIKKESITLQGLTFHQLYSCKINFTNVTTHKVVGYSRLIIIKASIALEKEFILIPKAFTATVLIKVWNDYGNPFNYYVVHLFNSNHVLRQCGLLLGLQELNAYSLLDKHCKHCKNSMFYLHFNPHQNETVRYELKWLTFMTNYTIKIFTINKDGPGRVAEKHFTTLKPDDLSIAKTSTTSTTITLEFNALYMPQFVELVAKDSQNSKNETFFVANKGLVFTLTHLTPSTQYQISWRTQYDQTWYDNPGSVNIFTDEDVSTSSRNFSLSN